MYSKLNSNDMQARETRSLHLAQPCPCLLTLLLIQQCNAHTKKGLVFGRGLALRALRATSAAPARAHSRRMAGTCAAPTTPTTASPDSQRSPASHSLLVDGLEYSQNVACARERRPLAS